VLGGPFRAAGLDINRFRSDSHPRRMPPVYADERAAWDGPDLDQPADLLRVEAAACRGQPVHFFLGPADEPDRYGSCLGGGPRPRLVHLPDLRG